MTPQEAIEKLKDTKGYVDAIQMGIEALEKQVPIKCKMFKALCTCGKTVYPHMNYCTECGQKLEWGD